MLHRRVPLLIIALLLAIPFAALAQSNQLEDGRRPDTTVVQAPALPGAQPISSRDRVYTADQSSNTVSVINPATNQELGTIRLGGSRLDGVLGPVDTGEVKVHGLGFSPDGRLLDVISVTSNAAQVIDPATNTVQQTTYVRRAPHEGFISPDGKELWVAVRAENHVAVIRLSTGEVVDRIVTAPGASKVIFSPDGRLAFVNHLSANELDVIEVSSHKVIERIPIPLEAGGSADEAITPDGTEVWLGHPNTGKTTVVDAQGFAVKAVLDTGPRTNHPNFVTKPDGAFAYVTVGGLNQTLVFRRTDGQPELVARIQNQGESPHGIWPSPDNTRVYVALQKSDAVDVINTATNQVIATLRIGQDPQALVYVANAVPEGDGSANLTQQGLGKRIETLNVDMRGVSGGAKATIRAVQGLDEIDLAVRGLPPNQTFTVFAANGTDAKSIMDVQSNARGVVPEALAFTTFFENYDRVILVPKGQQP